MIRVLNIVGGMSCGGAETMIMNLYRNIDRMRIQFDFFLVNTGVSYYEPEIEKLGGRIFVTSKRSQNLFKYCKDLFYTIKKYNYNVVHIHTSHVSSSLIPAVISFMAGARIRICHSHNTQCKPIWLHKIFRPFLNLFLTKRLACGEMAGKWMYGNHKKFEILPLPVDCKKFEFSDSERKRQREELNITNEFVIGHVGRFEYQKNHEYLIDIFADIVGVTENVKLVLIGDGNLKENIRNKIKKLNLEDKIIFTGVIKDVYNKMNAFDCILFPSYYEGFPTVILEAQANGLPCFISDTITKEIKLTDLVYFLPLSNDKELWRRAIFTSMKNETDRKKYNSIIAEKYDVKIVSSRLQRIYENKSI